MRKDSFENENIEIDDFERYEKKGSFVKGIIVGMASALLIFGVVYVGTGLFGLLSAGDDVTVRSVAFEEDSVVKPELLAKLKNLEKVIDDYFYLDEISDEELTDGIYRGLLAALNDKYSEYYNAEELNNLLNQTEGIYYGVGAYISTDTSTGLPKIAGVIAGAPAEEAQLRADDLIYEVDGVSTSGMSLTEVVNLIKGPENSEVVFTIVREGESDYLEIPVTRKQVESPTVEFEMLDEETAYIRITEFDEVTIDQFTEALAMAKGSEMEGLILDLRGNPGGSMNAVVEIARMMLPQGLIVYTEDKNGERVEYACDGKRELQVPLVVLIDSNSASAAEILAGAIQDYGIGTLVGTTTYGKGIVQQIISLPDKSAVKITIGSYFTPNGRDIHGLGIEPDVEIEFDGETYYSTEDHYDNQLEKAKEVLKKSMQ